MVSMEQSMEFCLQSSFCSITAPAPHVLEGSHAHHLYIPLVLYQELYILGATFVSLQVSPEGQDQINHMMGREYPPSTHCGSSGGGPTSYGVWECKPA